MYRFFRQVIGNNVLLKVTSYNAIGVVVKLATGLVSSKVIAFYLGAPGMALLGDLRNFMTSVHSISTLGIYNGIVKFTSEFKTDQKELPKVLSTALVLNLTAAVVLGLVLFFGASYWNDLVFENHENFEYIFKLTATAIPFYTLFLYSQALFNGLAKYKLLVNIGIVGNILTLAGSVALIYFYGIDGAFFAAIFSPVLTLLVTLFAVAAKRSFLRYFNRRSLDMGYVKKLSSYAGMTLVSAALSPLVYIAIRQEIIDVEGIANAGLWDAMTRLGDYYMMFGTTVMTLYILPKLSEQLSAKAFRREIFNFYKTILPIFGVCAFIIFILRKFIVQIVFTKDFLPMEELFLWQLVGDFFRLASVVIAYQFIAKNMFWYFVVTQIISLGTIYASSVFFINQHGALGATMAHALSYALYLVMMLLIFRKSLFSSK